MKKYMIMLLAATLTMLFLSACANSSGNLPTPAAETGNYDFSAIDLKTLILKPEDLKDLYPNALMSMSESNEGKNVRAYKLTYPTNSIEHTLAFSEGFETNVEVYSTAAKANLKYRNLVTDQQKSYKRVNGFDGDRQVFEGNIISPEGFDTGNHEYVVYILNHNVVYTLRLRGRPGSTLPQQRISQIIELMISRLPK